MINKLLKMKNEKKISKNKIADWSDKMDTKYGKQGSETRTNFETKAQAFYIGELLKEGRKQAKLTQKQMAEKTGTKKSYISRVENGHADIQLSTLYKLIEMGLNKKLKLAIT